MSIFSGLSEAFSELLERLVGKKQPYLDDVPEQPSKAVTAKAQLGYRAKNAVEFKDHIEQMFAPKSSSPFEFSLSGMWEASNAHGLVSKCLPFELARDISSLLKRDFDRSALRDVADYYTLAKEIIDYGMGSAGDVIRIGEKFFAKNKSDPNWSRRNDFFEGVVTKINQLVINYEQSLPENIRVHNFKDEAKDVTTDIDAASVEKLRSEAAKKNRAQ